MVEHIRAQRERRKWALSTLRSVKGKHIKSNHPDAIRAMQIVGFDEAVSIVTGIPVAKSGRGQDAMYRVVPGSYGSRK